MLVVKVSAKVNAMPAKAATQLVIAHLSAPKSANRDATAALSA